MLGVAYYQCWLNLAECIWSWEFVDMVNLLPDQWLVQKDEPAVHLGGCGCASRDRFVKRKVVAAMFCILPQFDLNCAIFWPLLLLAYAVGIVRVTQDYSGTAWAQYNATYRQVGSQPQGPQLVKSRSPYASLERQWR